MSLNWSPQVFFVNGKYENYTFIPRIQLSKRVPNFPNFAKCNNIYNQSIINCRKHYITALFSSYKMGNKGSTQNIQPKDLKDLKKSTKFTEKELKDWYKDFLKVVLNLFTCEQITQFFSHSALGITCRIISHRLSPMVLYLRENFKKFTLNSFHTVMQTRYQVLYLFVKIRDG